MQSAIKFFCVDGGSKQAKAFIRFRQSEVSAIGHTGFNGNFTQLLDQRQLFTQAAQCLRCRLEEIYCDDICFAGSVLTGQLRRPLFKLGETLLAASRQDDQVDGLHTQIGQGEIGSGVAKGCPPRYRRRITQLRGKPLVQGRFGQGARTVGDNTPCRCLSAGFHGQHHPVANHCAFTHIPDDLGVGRDPSLAHGTQNGTRPRVIAPYKLVYTFCRDEIAHRVKAVGHTVKFPDDGTCFLPVAGCHSSSFRRGINGRQDICKAVRIIRETG